MSDRTDTVCPLCGVGCRLEAGPESRARGVSGPANPAGRLCAKGVGAFDIGDTRLTEPQIRRNGSLEPVSWADALEYATAELTGVRERAGPNALAFLGAPHCTNEENYLLQKIARMLGTNNVDNRSRLCHVDAARTLAERLGWPATTNSLADIDEADVIIIAGANPAERQPVAFNSFVRPAVTSDTTLVHVDPVANRTTRLADFHLAPRPGLDATVFDLLSADLVALEDTTDEAFIADRTRGFERFRDSLSTLDQSQALAATGVDEGTLTRVGTELANADRVAAMVGTGIERDGTGTAGALLDLLLLTGSVGRPGTGMFILRGLANEQGAADMGCVPDYLPGYQSVTDPEARDRLGSEWGITPPSTPGRTARELLAGFGQDIQGALVVGENPAVSKRERAWTRRRLDSLDILVVVDIMPNSTTERADVVLPAAAGVEKSGTITNLERRVQRFQQAATPPGDSRSDLAILSAFGKRLTGSAANFDYDGPASVFDEVTSVTPTHAGVRFEEIDAGGRQWPFDRDGILYRTAFDTADGLAAFGTVREVPEPGHPDALQLVTGGRTSEFTEDESAAVVRLADSDAAQRGIESGDDVVVTDGEAELLLLAQVDTGVRAGTAYLPASVADPLLRTTGSTVRVQPVSKSPAASP